MEPKPNVELVRELFETLVNEKRLDALDGACAEAFTDHGPPAGVPQGGVAATRRGFERLFAGLPDVRGRIDAIFGQGDVVFVRSTLSGTHLGELMGLRPTGKRLVLEVWHLFSLADGKITEHRSQSDTLMLLRQLSAGSAQKADVILIPPPEMPTTLA